MADQGKDQIRKRVHRPAASATWEHDHRWGTQFGDITKLRVTRTDGGSLSIAYGRESIEVREELVALLAEMVATAAEWSDTRVIPPGSDGAA